MSAFNNIRRLARPLRLHGTPHEAWCLKAADAIDALLAVADVTNDQVCEPPNMCNHQLCKVIDQLRTFNAQHEAKP